MKKHNFLVEIGTEELPAKILRKLAQDFAAKFSSELSDARISYNEIKWFATPRRLALKVISINSVQSDSYIEKIGPAISNSFDQKGNPTKAAIGWAKFCGINLNQAERMSTHKGEWLVYRYRVIAKPVKSLLCNIVSNTLAKLALPNTMRWGTKDYKFIRPVRTVTLLLDDEVITGTIMGIVSDRIIRGHRFMGENEIILLNADCYPKVLLERGRVVADYEIRKNMILSNAENLAKTIGGFVDINDNILEEITSLVEWPIVLIASFDTKFLKIPTEALVYTMIMNQKYFPIYDATTKQILPKFIFVANIESKNTQQVISGNTKVILSRLADTEFFFNTDRKNRLIDNLSLLDTVIFQAQLGTLRDKSLRIEVLASWIAKRISTESTDVEQASRAGLLSKCDLITNMVFEYPEIQGIIGMHYALLDGENENVALAQKEQYMPRFSGDKLPTTLVSCAVAIADKMDTLVGMFGISQHPKKNKDPLALRRAAISIIRIIIEKKLPLDLQSLTIEAVFLYNKKLTNNQVINEVINFMFNRLCSWYSKHGYSTDTINSVVALKPMKPVDFDARIRAVSYFSQLQSADIIIAIHKRISNIIEKSKIKIYGNVEIQLLQEQEEITLMNYLVKLNNLIQPYFLTYHYQEALIQLVSIREIINNFFDKIFIMTEKQELRINRLNLLFKVRQLFLQVADFSLLNGNFKTKNCRGEEI
ncbi:glycine--tRNA ligase subunit beta [Candidatus Palibaumannia cicadellinicola]|uniref:Glycine--tRNA ligase beta subunit n=1 Tax=Candidatus Palibaumannia cicadellinicola TaxID=186490 RepID=A0A0K2BKL3_9GAMM|nr:glycine--tRNA ligase subunit beta [Candidatus Baumannia cicadellinicola]AKZ65752.1 Glycyl-tRNA synthetase beta chain [Candidatus Baumannia cicadellinicola]